MSHSLKPNNGRVMVGRRPSPVVAKMFRLVVAWWLVCTLLNSGGIRFESRTTTSGTCSFGILPGVSGQEDELLPDSIDAMREMDVSVEVPNDEPEGGDEDVPRKTAKKIMSDPPQNLPGTVVLTDKNFEHLTQASTGQTTGSWLVYFYDSDKEPKPMSGEVPPKSFWDEEYYITLAAMDITTTTSSGSSNESSGFETFRRFHARRSPSFLLIHKGMAYILPRTTTSANGYYSWDDIVSFIQKPDAEFAFAVPPVPSMWRKLLEEIAKDKNGTMYLFFGMLAVMAIGVRITYTVAMKSTLEHRQQQRVKKSN